MYLVDTDVFSAAAPTKAVPLDDLLSWMDVNSFDLFVSVVTIAEIVDGIEKLRRGGAIRKAGRLGHWLDAVCEVYGARILPLDLAAARQSGRLLDRARGLGFSAGFADAAIAGTAVAHDLTVLTRNTRHFAPLGVAFHDPFEHLPPTPG